MKRIVCTLADGSVAVVVPCISADDPPGFTEAQALERARLNVPATTVSTVDIDPAVTPLPASRMFRNAWVFSAGSFAIDIVKAREILRARIRDRAGPRIQKAESDWIAAQISHNHAAEVAAENLRAAMIAAPNDPAIAAATTAAQLEALDALLPPP